MAGGSLPWPIKTRRRFSRLLRAALYALNIHTLALCLLACTSTWLAQRFGLAYQLEYQFIALGLTFPLTFNITQAFTRRERALVALAEIKASVIALYWQHRDWMQDEGFPGSLGNDRTGWAVEFANTAMEFLTQLQMYVQTHEGYESLSEIRVKAHRKSPLAMVLADTRLQPDLESLNASFISRVHNINQSLPGYRHIQAAYAALNRMSVMNEHLTFKAGYTRGGEGGLSRTAQYFRYLMSQMEQLRMIKLYRTPFMLRYCTSVLIHAFAVLLGPHFAHVGVCEPGCAPEWLCGAGCPAPYAMACIYSIICMLLLNVQDTAEMPFDGSGLDDVFVELASEFADVLDLGPPEPVPGGKYFDCVSGRAGGGDGAGTAGR